MPIRGAKSTGLHRKVEPDRRDITELFGFIPSGDVIGWRCAPVIGTSGLPLIARIGQKHLQGMIGIRTDIGRKAQPRTGFQHAGKRIQKFWLDQPPLLMARLRPGVGEQDESA